MNSFAEIVEEIKNLDYDDLQEINHITSRYMIEKERDRIKKSHEESLQEYKDGVLKFSSNFDELKKELQK
jgi:hypothetical protein